MMFLVVIAFAAVLLAYANGANDNFKGVATLLGSGTSAYRGALLWATVTTALGSVTALVVARGLLASFSGSGLVPPAVVADPAFSAAVALATGSTVLLATRLGFPISTTHALLGGLVGAGLVASAGAINFAQLANGFLVPLLISPFLAVGMAIAIYPLMVSGRRMLGISKETCVCMGDEIVGIVPDAPGRAQALAAITLPSVAVDVVPRCEVRYRGSVVGVSASTLLDTAHYLSAGAVSFSRGLNDTPKIAALLLVGPLITPTAAIVSVCIAMAVGGLISARRVAETMAHHVTDMNAGQGFTANAITALLVIGASRLSLPVSTTHVSCGSLFGIGAVTRQAHWRMIGSILLAWLITLPLAATLGAVFVVSFKASFP